ncbi:MAG: CpaF family protein [Candidatus Altiarchaeota archaeon]|nr:CpaF family protein [Candidatus Altiarchaeota archaeon]
MDFNFRKKVEGAGKEGENKAETADIRKPKGDDTDERATELDSYNISLDGLTVEVKVLDVGDYVPHYHILLPDIDFVTTALLDETKRSLVGEIQFETQSILSPDRFLELKTRFLARSKEKLANVLKKASGEDIAMLSRMIVNDMIGIGDIEYLLADGYLEEIVINSSKDVVWAYHKKHNWLKTNIQVDTEDMIMNYSSRIAREVGREITHLEPLLDAHLSTGDRVNATLFPISTSGNTITIRRFSRTPWTMIHLIDPAINTTSTEAAAFLWLSIEYELSMLISGGTASGKTSMLNALMPFMPANQRIISLEDTRELNLPKFLHWVPLTTRPPNPRGEGEVSMLQLVENSLRMRPDRIVVGEVRRKRETEVLFEAMHTGHSVYGTFHANRAQEVVDRIMGPPMDIPGLVMGSLPLIVVQHMNRKTGKRHTLEIAELTRGEGSTPKVNILYQWTSKTNKTEKISESVRVKDELELFSGMDDNEIREDLAGKERILKWLLEHDIKNVNDVGKIVTEYYIDKDTVLDLVEGDKDINI